MASRWCAVYDNEKARRDELEAQLKEARNQLRQDMEKFNRHDFMQEHTMQLRARELPLLLLLLLLLPLLLQARRKQIFVDWVI